MRQLPAVAACRRARDAAALAPERHPEAIIIIIINVCSVIIIIIIIHLLLIHFLIRCYSILFIE